VFCLDFCTLVPTHYGCTTHVLRLRRHLHGDGRTPLRLSSKVRRGEVVLVDLPYSDHTGNKSVQRLLCKRMRGISAWTIPCWRSLPVVGTAEWEPLRS
jgi:hypothetical protein